MSFYDRYGEETDYVNTANLRIASGPYKPETLISGTWGTAIFNSTIKYAVVDSVDIEYINGTSASFEVNKIVD